MMLNRRALLLGGAAVATLAASLKAAVDSKAADPDEIIELWPAGAPGGEHVSTVQTVIDRANPGNLKDRAVRGVRQPTLTVFRAPRKKRAKTAGPGVLIIPGGSYKYVVVDKEGLETARWLASQGVTAFVLLYRLPGDGWTAGPDTPLQDAQRAMRLIRSRAADFNVEPARIGVQGFSAGGHLAATLATRSSKKVYEPVDDADATTARPHHAALVYPVISMQDPIAHTGSRDLLLGESRSFEQRSAYSPDQNLPADVPPTWLLHADDDDVVPVENSQSMYTALRRANARCELHVFDQGGHGFGLRGVDGHSIAAWPQLYLDWTMTLT